MPGYTIRGTVVQVTFNATWMTVHSRNIAPTPKARLVKTVKVLCWISLLTQSNTWAEFTQDQTVGITSSEDGGKSQQTGSRAGEPNHEQIRLVKACSMYSRALITLTPRSGTLIASTFLRSGRPISTRTKNLDRLTNNDRKGESGHVAKTWPQKDQVPNHAGLRQISKEKNIKKNPTKYCGIIDIDWHHILCFEIKRHQDTTWPQPHTNTYLGFCG